MNIDRKATAEGDPEILLRLAGITKQYGLTKALAGVDLILHRGEITGLVGHNGAGKSTLMRVIVGITAPDTGELRIGGTSFETGYSLAAARAAGIRIVFQELSLAPTLAVFENALVADPGLAGWGWRRRAKQKITRALDEIFPGHGINARQRVEELTLAQQQMLEIALAIHDTGENASLLILDEPTSALAKNQADNLFAYLRGLRERGVASVLISHKLQDILGHTDRTVVMRDGRVVSEHDTAALDYDQLVTLMGGVVKEARAERSITVAADAASVLTVRHLPDPRLTNPRLELRGGEIVGLSGLDGQGQNALLRSLWSNRRRRRFVETSDSLAFVTGDRATAGTFPLWDVGQNIGIGVLKQIAPFGFVDRRKEKDLIASWVQRLAVRGTATTPIVDLSGGNQQKALLARALASSARIVLLDDPLRGVDLETKQQVYRILRAEADRGRSFLWFTTENAELAECDRVYVMSRGSVAAELIGDAITEEAVIAASFEGID